MLLYDQDYDSPITTEPWMARAYTLEDALLRIYQTSDIHEVWAIAKETIDLFEREIAGG